MTVEILGKDICLSDFDIQFTSNQDFLIVENSLNLRQAIIDRLLTNKGEYNNTLYGSELYKVIGQPRTELLKSQISGYIVEVLNQEPRVQSIENIIITYPDDNEHTININITVLPIESTISLNLIFPLFI